MNRKPSVKITKCLEFIKFIEEDRYFIKVSDKRLFSNGDRIGDFWRGNKEKIYEIASLPENKEKYPFAYDLIDKKYHDIDIKLTLDQKVIEVFKLIEVEGAEFLKNHKCFYDGSLIKTFIHNHLALLWETINNNNYKKKYPQSYVVIFCLKHKKITNKSIKFLNILEQKGRMIVRKDNEYFEDGSNAYQFWYKNKEVIYYISSLDENKQQYPQGCQIVKKAYRGSKYSIDKKCLNYIRIVDNKGCILMRKDPTRLECGTLAANFAAFNFDRIYEIINQEENRNKYPVAYQLLNEKQNKFQLTIEQKAIECLKFVEQDQKMIRQTSKHKFSDGSLVSSYITKYRNKIYEVIQQPEMKQQYPKAYQIIMKDYIKMLKRKQDCISSVIDNWTMNEYSLNITKVCNDNGINEDLNRDILYRISYLEFVSKINYLKQNNIDLVLENGRLNPIFAMKDGELLNNYKIDSNVLTEKYFDIKTLKLI